jgi:hypothetical protein
MLKGYVFRFAVAASLVLGTALLLAACFQPFGMADGAD